MASGRRHPVACPPARRSNPAEWLSTRRSAGQGGLGEAGFYRLFFVVLCAGFGVLAGCQSRTAPQIAALAPAGPVDVVGTLTLMVGGNDNPSAPSVPANQRIELPDVDVFLREAASGTAGSKKRRNWTAGSILRLHHPARTPSAGTRPESGRGVATGSRLARMRCI